MVELLLLIPFVLVVVYVMIRLWIGEMKLVITHQLTPCRLS